MFLFDWPWSKPTPVLPVDLTGGFVSDVANRIWWDGAKTGGFVCLLVGLFLGVLLARMNKQ